MQLGATSRVPRNKRSGYPYVVPLLLFYFFLDQSQNFSYTAGEVAREE